MADVEDGEESCALSSHSGSAGSKSGGDKMFSLKKWNAVAMWSWDVECDTCAICRVQVMGKRCTRGPGRATAFAGGFWAWRTDEGWDRPLSRGVGAGSRESRVLLRAQRAAAAAAWGSAGAQRPELVF